MRRLVSIRDGLPAALDPHLFAPPPMSIPPLDEEAARPKAEFLPPLDEEGSAEGRAGWVLGSPRPDAAIDRRTSYGGGMPMCAICGGGAG